MWYMVTIRGTARDEQGRARVAALVPAEQSHIREWIAQGIAEALHVADGGHAWLILRGDSPEHVQELITTLPLYPYMDTEIHQITASIPQPSDNYTRAGSPTEQR